MANCSIPNSTPATGRTSTTSSRRSKSSSNRQFFCRESCQLPVMGRRRPSLQLGSTFFLNSAIRKEFTRHGGQFPIGRVKGAWWPSRSSKPSSPRKWRGRFDSYPLRLFIFRFSIFDFRLLCSQRRPVGGKELHGKEVISMSREQIRKLTSLSSCAG